MNTPSPVCRIVFKFFALLAAVFLVAPAFAQETTPAPATGSSAGGPDEAEMMKQMMEMAKPNENHKLLADLNGNWSYVIKMWMDGDTSKKPQESKGTAVRKSIMGGKFFSMEVNSVMEMPDEHGKMKSMPFHGMGTEGYDNAKKKFVGTWMDSMGTGIMNSEGDYDAATKTFTYNSEYMMMPGMNEKIKEVLKLTDKDHMVFDYYETRGGKEMKTMEIDYTRKK